MSNREKRLEQMGRGMEELRLWLADTVRQGLGQLEAQGEQAFERLAARMVDAKLGSIGRRVRNWKNLLKMADWQEQLLVEMGELFLAVSAFERSDTLSDELTMDLLQFAGLSLRKEEVLAGDPVEGPWGVAGVAEGEEENLRFRRTWLKTSAMGASPCCSTSPGEANPLNIPGKPECNTKEAWSITHRPTPSGRWWWSLESRTWRTLCLRDFSIWTN
ncbi:MAG: hypothetical protein IPJ00_01540 [Saprospirales bacterium]|nr:hypothetical protein [Saprospirales bacterium]